jgi:hypothetical protein
MHEADGVWTTQIWPVNVRPRSALVFECVESGDVKAVRNLLQSGQLSIRDHKSGVSKDLSLFEVSFITKDSCKFQASLPFAAGGPPWASRALQVFATRELDLPQ